MDARGWHRLVGGASMLAGGVTVVAIAIHAVAVTSEARTGRGGLDGRWAVLQLIGFLAALAGAVLAVGGLSVWRGRGDLGGWLTLSGTAALFLALLLSFSGVLGPFVPMAFGIYLLLLGIGAHKLGVWGKRRAGAAS